MLISISVGGVHFGTRALHVLNLIWYGYIARLSQWGGGDNFIVQMNFTCFAEGGGRVGTLWFRQKSEVQIRPILQLIFGSLKLKETRSDLSSSGIKPFLCQHDAAQCQVAFTTKQCLQVNTLSIPLSDCSDGFIRCCTRL